MKKLGCGVIMLLLLLTLMPLNTYAVTNAPTRVINVVYDDSGSMYASGNTPVDTWCQAKYSMEVFASMLGENDIMNIYYMSDYQNSITKDPRITMNGKDGASANVARIHKETTSAGNTPFNSVKKAYSDLSKAASDEKWLVILTDGEFQGVDGKSGIDAFLAGKDAGVNVMFLGMGTDADGITPNEANNIFYVEAKTNSQILSQITGICTRIFNSHRLNVNVSSKSVSFDVPMGELIVFAQGANVQINGIHTGDGTLIKSAKAPVEVKYSSCDATNYTNKPSTDLVGSIATFIDDFAAGSYSIDVSGAETLEIYYKPNIEVAAYLTDSSGVGVEDLSTLEAGEYTISFGFVKTGTQEKVAASDLLGDVSYSATVTNNGETHEKIYTTGDVIPIEEGTLSIDVIADYLEYNSVSTSLSYNIFKNKEITFSIDNDPAYTVTSEGFAKDEKIKLQAKIDGKDFTEEQWAQMQVPTIKKVNDKQDFNIDLSIEKSAEIGVFTVTPMIPDGKPSTGTYCDTEYLIEYQQQLESETWKGNLTSAAKIQDSRSWLERNWDKVVKVVISLAVLFLVVGYLPFIKRYLPRSLKKMPYISAVSSEPGEGTRDRKGSVEKKFLSTIIPYVAQKGTIMYVSKGVVGCPKAEVKAIRKKGKMLLTNAKDYASKPYITFDGAAINRDVKDFEIFASVVIKAKRNNWTYTCSPNQTK